VPVVIGTLGFLLTPRPDIRVDEGGVVLAARMADGNIAARAKNMDDFEVKVWRQRDGLQDPNGPAPRNWFDVADKGGEGPLSCKGYDCVYTKAGHSVAFPMSNALPCDADVIIGALADNACPGKIIINRAAAAQKGSHAIYLSEKGIKIETAMDADHKRPWE
jgi:competence protein ComEC